jgi:general secretion pathway protein A
MIPLYGEYFGLTSQPFSVSPDPKFLYPSPSHREGLAQLTYGIRARRGFVVLTGEVGTGKTTLIHSLLQQLDDGRTHIAFVFTLVTSMKDLLRSVCEDFGLIPLSESQKDLHDYLAQLNQFLLESYRKGDNVALVVDEAQNLSPEVLEGVRLLSNFETSEDKVLQILLVGQPELSARLNRPELRQLKQRIALRYHLSPLNLGEVKEYIAKRLEIAGGRAAIFPAKTIDAVHAYSGGIPRLINILCDNGMLTAYAMGRQSVEVGMIEEIARDLNLSVGPGRSAAADAEIIPIKLWEASPPAPAEKSSKVADTAGVKTQPDQPFPAKPQPVAKPAENETRPSPVGPAPAPKPEIPPEVEKAPALTKPAPDSKTEIPPAPTSNPETKPVIDVTPPSSIQTEPVSKPAEEMPPASVSPTPPPKPEIAPAPISKPPPAEAAPSPPKPEPFFKPLDQNMRPFTMGPSPAPKPPVAEEPKSAVSTAKTISPGEPRKTPSPLPAPPTFTARASEPRLEAVPTKSFSLMISALTEAMGPMAPLVVREQVDAMGESLQAFPKHKLRRLVEVASREILSDALRADFMNLMSGEIRAIHHGKEDR